MGLYTAALVPEGSTGIKLATIKKTRKLSRRMQIYWEASHLKSPVSEKGLDQLLLWEKNSFGLQELVSRPHIPVLLCSTVKNTDTLLKVHPVVFRGLSGALLRFLGSQFLSFCAANQFSQEALVR